MEATQQPPTRETAKICSLQELVRGKYVVQEGWKPNYVLSAKRKLSRVNVMGVVVDKKGPFQFLLDDGSASITVIDFNNRHQTAQLVVGNPVLVIGRPRQSEQGIFIASEIAVSQQLKRHPSWLVQRKKDIENGLFLYDETSQDEKQELQKHPIKEGIEQEGFAVSSSDLSGDAVVTFIKQKDDGHGCNIEEVVSYFGQEADDVILTLLSMGEIYEHKPGKLKVLE